MISKIWEEKRDFVKDLGAFISAITGMNVGVDEKAAGRVVSM
jgi:hypothetical protein